MPVVGVDTCGILRAVRSTIYHSGLFFFVNTGVAKFMVFILSASIVIGLMQAVSEMNKGSV